MRAETLDEAIDWQNVVDYGPDRRSALPTGGDPFGWRGSRWATFNNNRAITGGAIVRRQSFADAAFVGAGTKVGGPNHHRHGTCRGRLMRPGRVHVDETPRGVRRRRDIIER